MFYCLAYLSVGSGPEYDFCWRNANSNLHCYYVIRDVSADDALTQCATPNGYFARIESSEEQENVGNLTFKSRKNNYMYMYMYIYMY